MRARGSTLGLMLLLLCTAAAITTEILPVGLLPAVTRDLRIDDRTAGLLVSAYALVVAVFAIPLTRVTGRFRRKQLLLATIIGYGVSNLLVAVGPTLGWVIAGRALGGVTHALFFSVSNAYATRLVPPERQGRAIAFVSVGASVGYLGGVPLSTALGTAVGWRVSFAVIGALILVLGVLVGTLLPAVDHEPPGAPVAAGDAAGRRVRMRAIGIVGTANMLTFFAQYSLYTFIAVLFLRAGIPEAGIGPALFLLAAGGLAGLLLAGRGLDHRMTTVLVVALGVAALGVGVTGLLGGSPVGVLAGSTVWLAGFGALAPSYAAACIRTGAFSPDIGSAVNNAASNIGLAVGAAVGGTIMTGAGVGVSVLVSVGVFVVAALVLAIGRPAFRAV